jgi:hypothetical protein
VGGAFHAIDAILLDREDELFVDLAFEGFDAFRQHTLHRLDIVALVRRHESDRIARRGPNQVSLEDHHALLLSIFTSCSPAPAMAGMIAAPELRRKWLTCA